MTEMPYLRDVLQYCRDLGWSDPPDLPEDVGRDGLPAATTRTAEDCASLADLEELLRDCTRCALSRERTKVVFGEGPRDARLLIVGEAPGGEEDRSGRPFVGQAGQLLDAMIQAIGLRRDEVFIANVVKCRPPRNRQPADEESGACAPFLDRQIGLLEPRVIVALGAVAAHRLLATTAPISALRGRWGRYRGIPVLPTFHPAYLLRNPLEKRTAWSDFKAVRQRLVSED